MDCGDLSKRTYQNLVFWMAWRDGARLARALGHDERAVELEALASAHRAAIRRAFKDGDAALSCVNGDDAAESRIPDAWNTVLGEKGGDPLSCAMLLASGFADNDEARVLARDWCRTGVGKFQAMCLRGKFRYGFTAEAMREIRDGNWSALADPAWPGAHCTTECLYLYTHGWWDESHPDTSISDVFQTYLLGVEPVEPGFRVFRIAPQPPDGLAWARGSVPTPHGLIEVEWRREKTGGCGFQPRSDDAAGRPHPQCGRAVRAPATLSISVPDGTTAVLSDGRILGPGHHELSIPQPKDNP
jgi:hypothetical protein